MEIDEPCKCNYDETVAHCHRIIICRNHVCELTHIHSLWDSEEKDIQNQIKIRINETLIATATSEFDHEGAMRHERSSNFAKISIVYGFSSDQSQHTKCNLMSYFRLF